MLIISTILSISQHLGLYLSCLLLATLVGIALNYIFLRTCASGLICLQVSLVFNTAIAFFGWSTAAMSLFRVAHCLLYELMVAVGVYIIYRKILHHRAELMDRLGRLNYATVSTVLVAFNLALFGLYLILVIDNDGASRIEFMTASWFSFFRPVMSILTPLSFIFPLHLLDCGKRFLPLSILFTSLVSNIASGSKGSFVIGIVAALLLYRDLKGSGLVISRSLKVILLVAMSFAAIFTLERLDVNLAALAERFVRFGESTIMVYYSEDPSEAAAGVSTFAKIHRGAAKLVGDASAADIDTAFGFALSRGDNGAHNFTGPNAQVSSYMLCNYSGWNNLIGVASILGYIAVVTWLVDSLTHCHVAGSVLFFPFVVASLSGFLQDYYQGMSDVTLMLIVALAFGGIGVTSFACRGARRVYDAA